MFKVRSMLQDLPAIIRLDQMAATYEKDKGYTDMQNNEYLKNRLLEISHIQNTCMVRNNQF